MMATVAIYGWECENERDVCVEHVHAQALQDVEILTQGDGEDSISFRNLALPSANSLFYTLHTIDAIPRFRSFFKALKGLFAPDGELSVIDSASLRKNVQTLFFYETIRKCETAEEYLLFQLNYHRSRISDSWWTGQSLAHDLERTHIDLKRNRDELARSKMLFATQLRKKASDLHEALDIAKIWKERLVRSCRRSETSIGGRLPKRRGRSPRCARRLEN